MAGTNNHDSVNREWRELILKRLDKQDESMAIMGEELTQIRLNTAQLSAIQLLDTRMRNLEDFKLKTVTVLIVLQFLASALFTFLARWLLK